MNRNNEYYYNIKISTLFFVFFSVIMPAVATRGTGLQDAVEWLADSLTTKISEDATNTPETHKPLIYTIGGAQNKQGNISDNDQNLSDENESLYTNHVSENGTLGEKHEVGTYSTLDYITCGYSSRTAQWLWGKGSCQRVNSLQ